MNEESSSDDESVQEQVQKSLQLLRSPSSSSIAQAFGNLTQTLTKIPISQSTNKSNNTNKLLQKQMSSDIYNNSSLFAAPLKKDKVIKPDTLGHGWFDIAPLKMDENLKRDVKMIEMRNFIDPKRYVLLIFLCLYCYSIVFVLFIALICVRIY